LGELKQLLNLEPPKINLNMFDNMNLDDGPSGAKPVKKLSTKQRRFQAMLKSRAADMHRDKNPKSLLDHQMESIENTMMAKKLQGLSRGQKRRLEKKIGKFASKRLLEDKGREVREEMAQVKK